MSPTKGRVCRGMDSPRQEAEVAVEEQGIPEGAVEAGIELDQDHRTLFDDRDSPVPEKR
jgi:hypothetical protein